MNIQETLWFYVRAWCPWRLGSKLMWWFWSVPGRLKHWKIMSRLAKRNQQAERLRNPRFTCIPVTRRNERKINDGKKCGHGMWQITIFAAWFSCRLTLLFWFWSRCLGNTIKMISISQRLVFSVSSDYRGKVEKCQKPGVGLSTLFDKANKINVLLLIFHSNLFIFHH